MDWGDVIGSGCAPGVYCLPGTIGGPRVLPRLEDRGQPPFLQELEAGNVGGSREGSRSSPLGPHAERTGPTLALRRGHALTAPAGPYFRGRTPTLGRRRRRFTLPT